MSRIFDSDDEENEKVTDTTVGSSTQAEENEPSQTQASVRNLLGSIFGNDDDDDDDEENTTSNQVTGSGIIPQSTIYDSDEEQTRKAPKKKKLKKLHKTSANKKASSSKEKNADEGNSSNDDEGKATAEDLLFIDSEDEENDEVLGEYRSDNQVFQEEGTGKKRKKAGADGEGRKSSKSNDPLSQTLEYIKKSKQHDTTLNDEQKAKMATNLLQQMDKAFRDDEIIRESGKPALNKLSLLPVVQNVCNFKQIQYTLLEYDVLTSLRMWIEPLDNGKSLPALSLRTAIYILLLSLPCQVDHLKKSNIGKTIVSLRQSKSETMENKKILKAIMEKWCRPIFAKSTDNRSQTNRISEQQHAIARARQMERMKVVNSNTGSTIQTMPPPPPTNSHISEPTVKTDTSDGINEDADGGTGHHEDESFNDENMQHATLSQETSDAHNPLNAFTDPNSDQNKTVDHRQRVRTPYTTGFYFTVRPESKASYPKRVERDVSICTETGSSVAVKMGSSSSSKSSVPDNYQTKLSKQITELNKKRGVMGIGVKKPFKLQLK